ncbi:hypothetical protein [Anaerospora hongkongensis]|uniref:hypothetical protein n=1 Tax=Anaerospora hongkongensis TaxID=244830 RepID=UPI00289FC89C|nr:hypothetical protein [Anaerospora hongkongensis]
MADDELREESQPTLSDDLLDIREAALSITAGAALFYRSGGAKFLSSGLEKSGRLLIHAHSEVSARLLQDWNSDELGNAAKSLRRAWKNIGSDVARKSNKPWGYLSEMSKFGLSEGEPHNPLEAVINKELQAAQESQVVLRDGRYTQSALLYKKAANSPVYGLREDVSGADLIRSLPKNEREYFIELGQERDPEKRKETLEVSSWSGWSPDVDTDVQVKAIHNEGMLLSDFGYYESQLREPAGSNAPNLKFHGGQDPLTLQASLQATLKGLGLWGVDVSVQPAPTSGVQVVANVARLVENKVENAVHDIFRLL